MKSLIPEIPLVNLLFILIPIFIVVFIQYKWSLKYLFSLYVSARMIIQLLLVGYVLTFIFETEYQLVTLGVLTIMLLIASWIAMRTVLHKSVELYFKTFMALCVGGLSVLFIVCYFVLAIEPWYNVRYLIPLGGMIFAANMNSVSLAYERFDAEIHNKKTYENARAIAYKAAMIPKENSFLAVGLVSLPGIMTGQVLSGVEPVIAARYQIMVMCMIYGSSGITTAIVLMCMRNVRQR